MNYVMFHNESIIFHIVGLSTVLLAFLIMRIKNDNGVISLQVNAGANVISVKKLLLVCLPMFLFASLQYGVGGDYFAYRDMFGSENFFLKEPVFGMLLKSLSALSKNPQILFFVTSAIILICVFSTVFKYSSIPCLSIFLFYITTYYSTLTLNVVRYAMALAICFYSFRYIEQRELKKFVFFMILAVGLHRTAAVFFPAFFIYFICVSYRMLWVFTGLLLIFRNQIGSVIRWLEEMSPYFNYIGGRFDLEQQGVWNIVICIVVLLVGQMYAEDDKKYRFFMYCTFVSMWIKMYSYFIPEVFRLYAYYEMFVFLLLPTVISNVKDKFFRYGLLFSIFLCYSYLGIRNYNVAMIKLEGALVHYYQTIFDVGLSIF